ncbi:MAG TPA: cytosine permease [Streptosporangiaceae bacterium]|nr:cytosine permease [Streptosporangiaceae bacterium]
MASSDTSGGLHGSAAPSVASVEHRGIEHIPHSDRWGRPSGLFWMWAGAVWNVEFVVYGALVVVFFGLSFAQAVLIILIGNLFYVLTGLASLQGPQAGTTTFGVSRASFGPNGNRLPSFFNWVTQVGFEIEGIALVVFAAILLTSKAGFTAGVAAKVIFIILAVAIQAALPVLGHAAVLKVLRWLTIPFIVLFAVLAGLATGKVNLHVPAHGASWGALTIALALVISAGGLGWTENGNDYSRYLPRDASKVRIVLAVALGGAIPSVLLEILGAAIATGVPDATTVNGLISGLPSWFIWPYLIFAIVQLFAINTIDLYSSGVTLQSLVPGLHRLQCVAIDTVIAGSVAAYAVFSSRFFTLLADFLLFIIVWLGPWCAIYLVDSWLRRNRYDHDALLNERGRYFRNGGVHWPAIIAQVLGMVCAAFWLNAYTPFVGYFASRNGGPIGSDFSVFIGLVVGGIVYYLLAGRSVKAEGEATATEVATAGAAS